MANWKKLAQGAAGAAGGAGLNVEDVFSTYLYTGTGSNQTITNGIDLSTEGGMVWIKSRNYTYNNNLFDSERGTASARYVLESNSTNAEGTGTFNVTTFNTDGFSLGAGDQVNTYQGYDYCSWTFRKAPKFFDVVTYTGNGVNGRQISHNLGSNVGMLVVKRTDSSSDWNVWHEGLGAGEYIRLNSTGAKQTTAEYRFGDGTNAIDPTSTVFTVSNHSDVNASGGTYVAYLFAHNNSNGGFGPTGDQDIIKCGSFTVNSSGWSVDLGFEPQWVMIKKSSGTSDWGIVDNMRSWDTLSGTGDNASQLRANLSNAENRETYPRITATGFNHEGAAGWLTSGQDYIYMAIRRGPMAVPESATDVFAIDTRYSQNSLPSWQSGFVTDLAISKRTTGSDTYVYDRLRQGKELAANASSSEASASQRNFDHMDGWGEITSASSTEYSWMWKRAPNYFDVVTYSGNSTAGRTVSHNLGVKPEMIWVKARSEAQGWAVYHSALGATKGINLNLSNAAGTTSIYWNDTEPTASNFTLNTTWNSNNQNYIAYLFASLDGISKVGSYTGNGGTQTIDCGFSNGAKFVLIKRTSDLGDWHFWDTERGIVTGNDPFLELNTNDAQNSSYDSIDPHSSGFTINNTINTLINGNGNSYIFYAIA